MATPADFGATVQVTSPDLERFVQSLDKQAPGELRNLVRRALRKMGKEDLARLDREQLHGGAGLNIRESKVRNSIKADVFGRDLPSITLRERIGWKAAQIFETGGPIAPTTRRALMVLLPAGYAGGQRVYNPKTISALIAAGKLQVIHTRSGTYVVQKTARQTIFIAKLVRAVHEKKRLDFFANFERGADRHVEILAAEAEKSLAKLGAEKASGGEAQRE